MHIITLFLLDSDFPFAIKQCQNFNHHKSPTLYKINAFLIAFLFFFFQKTTVRFICELFLVAFPDVEVILKSTWPSVKRSVFIFELQTKWGVVVNTLRMLMCSGVGLFYRVTSKVGS